MYSVYGSLAHFKAQSTCAQEPSHGHSYIGHRSLLHRHRNPSHIWTACVYMHYFTTALGHVQQSLNQRIELPSVMHWLRRPASRAQPPQYASKHTRHACFRLSRVTGRSGTKATSAELLAQPAPNNVTASYAAASSPPPSITPPGSGPTCAARMSAISGSDDLVDDCTPSGSGHGSPNWVHEASPVSVLNGHR